MVKGPKKSNIRSFSRLGKNVAEKMIKIMKVSKLKLREVLQQPLDAERYKRHFAQGRSDRIQFNLLQRKNGAKIARNIYNLVLDTNYIRP